MSSADIAALTATLRNMLADGVTHDPELADTVVTTHAPDLARAGSITANQINLFLFRAAVNPAWSNQPYPGRILPGEDAPPPVALTLSYLLTAYGRDNDTRRPFSHLLLGRAMGLLHDNAVLSPSALSGALPEQAPFHREPVRLSMMPMSIDEISKLWSSFQTHYRLSIAYEASVILIQSTRPVRSPLPALRLATSASASGAAALLTSLQPAGPVTLGSTVTLVGSMPHGPGTVVRISQGSQVWNEPPKSLEPLRFTVPEKDGPAAGWCTVSVVGVDRTTSNALPLPIAARITSPLPVKVTRLGDAVELTLDVANAIQPSQSAILLLGERQAQATPLTTPATRLHFVVKDLASGEYRLRLRIDGVDTQATRAGSGGLEFDPNYVLTVQP